MLVPLARPGVLTAAILVFFFAWNDVVFAISLTSSDRSRTVPAALAFFPGDEQFAEPVGSIAAAAVVVTVPVLVAALVFQRRLVAGLTAGVVQAVSRIELAGLSACAPDGHRRGAARDLAGRRGRRAARRRRPVRVRARPRCCGR